MRYLVVVALCAACRFEPGAAQRADASDDASIDMAPLGPWGAPTLVVTPNTDDDPTATADLLELYFNRTADIWVVRRAAIDADWGDASEVSQLSSGGTDTTPEITGDGKTMFLSSNRSGAVNGTLDLWVATRASPTATWDTPAHIPELSSTRDDTCSAATDDALAIVWNAGPANTEDLYSSQRVTASSAWDAPTAMTSLNTTAREVGPMLSQDRLTIYFSSTRDGNEDLYVATRATVDDPFSNPQPISELNTGFTESDPWVSVDGRHMFFSSDRSGLFGIYEVTR